MNFEIPISIAQKYTFMIYNTKQSRRVKYKVVQVWPGLFTVLFTHKSSQSYLNHLVHHTEMHWNTTITEDPPFNAQF